MMILGKTEPSNYRVRRIRRLQVGVSELLRSVNGLEASSIVVKVPSASKMVTVVKTETQPTKLSVYYECYAEEPDRDNEASVELFAVGTDIEIPAGAFLMGHFFYSGQVIAVYAKDVS